MLWGVFMVGYAPFEQAAVSLAHLSSQGPTHDSPHQVRRVVGGKVAWGWRGGQRGAAVTAVGVWQFGSLKGEQEQNQQVCLLLAIDNNSMKKKENYCNLLLAVQV